MLGKDLRNRTVKGVDIGRGTLGGEHFQNGALPAGPQGAQGSPGPRGPSFGDSFHVRNVNALQCGADNVVVSRDVTVPEPSRMWVFAQGAVIPDAANPSQIGFWVQLTSPGAAQPVASSVPAWETADVNEDEVLPMVTGGTLFSGLMDEPPVAPATHVVQPSSYLLQLVVRPSCATGTPKFGFNQGSVMSYMLLGAG